MEEICRVCLGSCDIMVNIFEGKQENGPSISDMIAQWSGYHVVKGDSLPENICLNCLQDARNAFDEFGDQLVKKEPSEVLDCETETSSSKFDCQNDGKIIEDCMPKAGTTSQELHEQLKNIPIEFYLLNYGVSEIYSDGDIDQSGSHIQAIEDIYQKRPFKCTQCQKSYKTKWNLTKHVRTHSGVRPFQCPECKKSFFRKWDLQVHCKTHTEGSFKCADCSVSYRYKVSLHKHICKNHKPRTK